MKSTKNSKKCNKLLKSEKKIKVDQPESKKIENQLGGAGGRNHPQQFDIES